MTSDSPPVDIERFRELMREAGVEEVVEEALRLFVQDAPSRFARLSRAVEEGHSGAVEMEAHALRSSSLNIWATTLAALLEPVEAAGLEGAPGKARGLLGPVEVELGRVVGYLEGELEAGA